MAVIDEYLNMIIQEGGREAHHDGSAAIEAHHLLLAMAAKGDDATRRVLTTAGLGPQAVRAALDREFAHSLNAAGVSMDAFGLPRPSPTGTPPTRLGASAKLALERGFSSVTRKKDLRPEHLLLGVLRAEAGTVPRALALAGVDRAGLITRLLPAGPAEAG
jgi:D-alanyl-D-alanine carboxypeptidase